MEFDIRTLVFIAFLVNGMLALMLLIYWKTQKTYDGFSLWMLGEILTFFGYFLLLLRGSIPAFFSIIVANILMAAGILVWLDGISRFTRSRPVSRYIYYLLLPLAILFLYLTYSYDSITLRTLVFSALLVPGLVFTGLIAVRSGSRENRSLNYAFAFVLCTDAFLYIARPVYWILVAEPVSIFSTDGFNSLFFIITILTDILIAGFFLMLNMARSQADLVTSEERYRMLTNSLPDYVVVHDGRTILYVNPASGQFTGMECDRIIGMPISMFIAPESMADVGPALEILQDNAVALQPHEIIIRSPDGRTHTCIIRSVPVRYQGADAILSVLTDINDRKQVEEAFRTTNQKLKLLSGITRHDINNQLLALSTYISLSMNAINNPEELRTFFLEEEKITGTIGRQIRFSRDYENLGVKTPAWQPVRPVAANAGRALSLQNTRLEISCGNLEIFADPLLEKVFYNLFDNSLRYGGSKLTVIRLLLKEGEDFVVIIAEDDGSGISNEDKAGLFTKGFGKNTGFGLFLSREILSLTGITIQETGTEGSGARFEIRVPEGKYRFRNDSG